MPPPDVPRLSDPGFHEVGAVRFREDRDPGAVLSAALRLAVAEARPLLAATLSIAGPMYLAAALVRIIGGEVAGAVLGSVVDLAAGVLLAAAVFGYVRLYVTGAPAEVADVWDATKPLLGPVLRVTVAGFLALLGLGLPVGLVGAAVAGVSVPVAGLLGVAALVAFVVLVLPLFAVTYVAVPMDALPVGEAYGRAAGLVREQRGRVLGTMVLVVLLTGFVLVLVLGAIGTAVGDATTAGGTVGAVATAALSLAVLPVSVVTTLAWCLLYGSLVERAEGTSLGEGLDALAAAGPLGPSAHDGSRPPEAHADAPPEDVPATGFRGGGFADRGTPDRGVPDGGASDREP